MKKLILSILMVMGTVTSMYSQSGTGFGFDVTNVYSYDGSVTEEPYSYRSSYIFDMRDSIFIHKVISRDLIQIYRIVDYGYSSDINDGSESHSFLVQGTSTGNFYYYGVIYYSETGEVVLVQGDDSTYSSGIIMEVDRVYKVNQ